VDWIGEAHIQIGADDAPPPAQLSPFLEGFVAAVAAHAAVQEAELLELDAFSAVHHGNPTRHVRFRFLAESYLAAERLASDELRRTGLQAGVAVLEPALRQFGWVVSIDVQPA
jgi:hypothetical protein